jgi:hypothetical protein
MNRSDRRGARVCSVAASVARQRAAGNVLYQMLLTLGAVTLWILLFAAFSALGGCARQSHQMTRVPCCSPADHGSRGLYQASLDGERRRASLIFAAEPGLTPIPADQIARADWPTTQGRTSYGQTVDYRLYVYDQQGVGPYYADYTQRTFTSWTTGQQSGQ